MYAAILIKIVLEITLFDFILPQVVRMIMYFLVNLEIIRSVFKLIFSRHQYLIDHLVKIYKATLNLAELISKV